MHTETFSLCPLVSFPIAIEISFVQLQFKIATFITAAQRGTPYYGCYSSGDF